MIYLFIFPVNSVLHVNHAELDHEPTIQIVVSGFFNPIYHKNNTYISHTCKFEKCFLFSFKDDVLLYFAHEKKADIYPVIVPNIIW